MNDEESEGFATRAVASRGGELEAVFVPDAGMVCCSLSHGGEELLDKRSGLRAYAERGKTLGIPLLYPWANRLAGFEYIAAGRSVTLPADRGRISLDPNGLPIHGVVPASLGWRVAAGDGGRLAARLSWDAADLLELFPFVHELELEAVATDASLTITTTLRASGDDTVPVSFGFHPYLRLPGGRRESWRVELPPSARLLLDERMIPTGEREPIDQTSFTLADSGWDDGLAGLPEPATFAVSRAGRRIDVEFLEGYRYGQIYAPPEHDVICFEPMTAPANALRSGDGLSLVPPGEQYRAVFRVAVA